MKRILSLIAAAALVPCCGENPADDNGGDPVEIIVPGEADSTDDPGGKVASEAEIPEEYKSYERIALKSSVTKVQPMTGIVMWSDSECDKTDELQLEFSYMLYNEVCRKKDVFDWTPMDNLLAEVASRGHQAVVRFRYTYVGKSCAVPDYIKKWEGYEETKGRSEGHTTYFPDWRCEELRRFHKEFHRRFAERYDSDPRLAFVQTGFGLWAEYHIYDGPYIPGQTFPSREFQAEFMQGMEEWFKHTTWSISIDAATSEDTDYGPFSEFPSTRQLRFGNFDDSFMCEDHDDYNYKCWKFFGENRYKIAPFGGEFSYFSNYDQKHCLDKGGMYGRKFEDEAAKFHMTYIIGADQPGYQSWDRIREASLSMGYKFRIKDFRISGDKAAVLIANVGVAPIYRDAFVAVDGVRSPWSLAGLMPGRQMWLEFNVPGLSAGGSPSIECDHLVPGQKIGFLADIEAEQ